MDRYSDEDLVEFFPPETQKNDRNLFVHLHRLTTREMVIAGAAAIEGKVKECIEGVLASREGLAKEFLKGPCHNFSSRMKLAHLLGITSAKEKLAIDALADIRNHFAHHVYAKCTDKNAFGDIWKRTKDFLFYIPTAGELRRDERADHFRNDPEELHWWMWFVMCMLLSHLESRKTLLKQLPIPPEPDDTIWVRCFHAERNG
jgi:hypothetical protein